MFLRWFMGGLALANRRQAYNAGFSWLHISAFTAPASGGGVGGELTQRRRRR
jgi:hypothetical protein